MSSVLSWILVRHGDTEWTEKKKLHGGRFDSPLSLRGRNQAELTGQALVDENINSIFSSPQGRALQTAEIIGDAIGVHQIEPIEGFREQRYGLLEGGPILTFGPDGTAPKVLKPFTTIVRNLTGESDRRFLHRVSEGVERVHQAHEVGRILVVAHWGVLSAMMASLFNGDANHWLENVKWSPCGITKIQEVDGRWEMVQQDDVRHLTELGR
jgi:broad specificity phosphatase PhoE